MPPRTPRRFRVCGRASPVARHCLCQYWNPSSVRSRRPCTRGYGLSETSPTAAVNQDAFGTKAGTVGHAVWGVQVEIAAPDEDEIKLLAADERGEIVVRGHNVFEGYHNNPEQTREVLAGFAPATSV
ncbi:AMP-binding protein [Kibdelosporangium aridum]|uniref:AMP-binding protein n=1 Tax=Kibdelosporangium aridum TaxID=2030 RepID=UPI0035E9B421